MVDRALYRTDSFSPSGFEVEAGSVCMVLALGWGRAEVCSQSKVSLQRSTRALIAPPRRVKFPEVHQLYIMLASTADYLRGVNFRGSVAPFNSCAMEWLGL